MSKNKIDKYNLEKSNKMLINQQIKKKKEYGVYKIQNKIIK
jgi:hypothetical protein